MPSAALPSLPSAPTPLARALKAGRALAERLAAEAGAGAPGLRLAVHAPGAVLIGEDSAPDRALLLRGGLARVSRLAPDGRPVVLAHRGPGEFLGELALLDGGARAGEATALADTAVIVISRAAFHARLSGDATFASALALQLAARVREASALSFALAAEPVAVRVGGELLRLARPDAAGALLIPGPLTVTDLARRVNATRERVSAIVSGWQAQGMIARDGKAWRILAPQALARRA